MSRNQSFFIRTGDRKLLQLCQIGGGPEHFSLFMFSRYNSAMLFRIHRMNRAAREAFRSAVHAAGQAIAKPKDYEPGGEIQAPNAYAAWAELRASACPLETGDILEDEQGQLHIAKYIGFEAAQWFVPEPKADGARAESEVGPVNGAVTQRSDGSYGS
jgi:hypothetical protein